jgi:hypothetical protein
MVNGTTADMNLNEVGAILGRNRGARSATMLSVEGRGIVQLRFVTDNVTASELWDVGKYAIDGLYNTTKLTQDEDSPRLIAAYSGELPSYRNGGHNIARKMINTPATDTAKWREIRAACV